MLLPSACPEAERLGAIFTIPAAQDEDFEVPLSDQALAEARPWPTGPIA
jgi:hypothetical protein